MAVFACFLLFVATTGATEPRDLDITTEFHDTLTIRLAAQTVGLAIKAYQHKEEAIEDEVQDANSSSPASADERAKIAVVYYTSQAMQEMLRAAENEIKTLLEKTGGEKLLDNKDVAKAAEYNNKEVLDDIVHDFDDTHRETAGKLEIAEQIFVENAMETIIATGILDKANSNLAVIRYTAQATKCLTDTGLQGAIAVAGFGQGVADCPVLMSPPAIPAEKAKIVLKVAAHIADIGVKSTEVTAQHAAAEYERGGTTEADREELEAAYIAAQSVKNMVAPVHKVAVALADYANSL